MLTGGLIHLVHQFAALAALPKAGTSGFDVGVLVTGVLTADPVGLRNLQGLIESWLEAVLQQDPKRFQSLRLIHAESELRPGDWDLACLNHQWQEAQCVPVQHLGIAAVVICGDALGVYYRCARELRAIIPSLMNRPIPWPARKPLYLLSGKQPLWHRPPGPVLAVSNQMRSQLFDSLVSSLGDQAVHWVNRCLAASPPGRPLWLLSVPNLAHQWPQQRFSSQMLNSWVNTLSRGWGFERTLDVLLVIDHPKSPSDGSLGPSTPSWVSSPLRSSVPIEVLIRCLQRQAPNRAIHTVGMTSSLYGVRALTGTEVVWLPALPLLRHNINYRRKPLEFLHRWIRIRRMEWLTSQLGRCQ